jgi:molybdate transport system regulatory protein
MYTVKGNIWIDGSKGTLIGSGRMLLLERIRELGSITLAARSMKMSYRQAWELVDSMNREARVPLVSAKTGGSGGGGAIVTAEGDRMLRLFKTLNDRFVTFCATESKRIAE